MSNTGQREFHLFSKELFSVIFNADMSQPKTIHQRAAAHIARSPVSLTSYFSCNWWGYCSITPFWNTHLDIRCDFFLWQECKNKVYLWHFASFLINMFEKRHSSHLLLPFPVPTGDPEIFPIPWAVGENKRVSKGKRTRYFSSTVFIRCPSESCQIFPNITQPSLKPQNSKKYP